MIKALIQIENGEPVDTFDTFGFIYKEADDRVAADEKEDAVSSYAEEEGEHRDLRTVDAPFDYSVKFIVEAPNFDLSNVNTRVNDFNYAIRERLDSGDVKRKREITFYNLYKHVKIVGLPEIIATPTKTYYSPAIGKMEFAEVELKIRVECPSKCDFNLTIPAGLLSESEERLATETGRSILMEQLKF